MMGRDYGRVAEARQATAAVSNRGNDGTLSCLDASSLLQRASTAESGKSAMKGFVGNIEELTVENEDFRRVLYTGHNLQLVLMTLQPGEEIGEEVHEDRDQFFRIEEGQGEVWIDGVCNKVKDDDAVIVPQGARHNVVNRSSAPLRVYTIYGPPEHVDGVVHRTKADADAAHEHFDGRTTE